MADDFKKEQRVRARLHSIYNKQEADFASREEYDEYLEEREDIILNLSEGIDVEATEAKLRIYERANFADIAAKEARKVEDKRLQAERAGQASAHAGNSAADSAPPPAAPSAGAGMQAAVVQAAMQPAPLQLPPAADRGISGLSSDAHARMAAASGWSPEFTRRRMLAEAFGSLFAA